MKILKIRDHGEMADRAAEWFHQKWSIPLEEYQESMAECLKKKRQYPNGISPWSKAESQEDWE